MAATIPQIALCFLIPTGFSSVCCLEALLIKNYNNTAEATAKVTACAAG